MATFTAKTFLKHDDYTTPQSAWLDIKQFIPKDKVIWESFYGDGKSGSHLEDMGFKVIHKPIDFFENDCGDILISNPPFSKSKEVLTRLKELNKPFIMILPVSKMNTQYFRTLFGSDPQFKIIVPKKRIHFTKLINGKKPDGWKNACNFDCFYYCWKMDTVKDSITWL